MIVVEIAALRLCFMRNPHSLAAQAAPDPRYVKVAETDAPNSTDSPFTGRYEGVHILGQTVKAFDELTLPSGPAEGKPYDNKKKFSATTTLEGKVTRTAYVAPLDAKRMRAKGVASLAPVATNRTGEGRAKNRRVELVEQ